MSPKQSTSPSPERLLVQQKLSTNPITAVLAIMMLLATNSVRRVSGMYTHLHLPYIHALLLILIHTYRRAYMPGRVASRPKM